MLNAGIIGCGKIAEVRHGPEYSENPETRILGYYDKDPARAQLMADLFGGKVYDSIEQMLSRSGNRHRQRLCGQPRARAGQH